MAEPIRKTPTLSGKDAEIFIGKMIKTQNRKYLTKTEKEFLRIIYG